jgi:hypothetical protein
MNLYIETENNLPKNHPATEENLLQAFPAIPLHWERFVATDAPIPSDEKVLDYENSTYIKIDGVWTNLWVLRDLNTEEKEIKKQNKINAYKLAWAALPQRDNFSTWVLNEETIKYEPPISRPTDREVIWSGANNGWVDRPPKPDDGKQYRIDFSTLSWVLVNP